MGELTTTLQNIETKLDNLKPPTIEIFEHDIMWFANTLVEEDGKLINRVIYDSKYWTCTKQDFQKILKWDSTNKKKYIPEQYDCDNFAMSFKSRVARYFHLNNVGLVIDMSSAHAYNMVVFEDKTWKLLEPQNDKWVKAGTKFYKFENKNVIF